MSDHATQVLEPPMAQPIDERDEKTAAQRARNAAAIRLLREWREGDESDEQEQRETWEYLKRCWMKTVYQTGSYFHEQNRPHQELNGDHRVDVKYGTQNSHN